MNKSREHRLKIPRIVEVPALHGSRLEIFGQNVRILQQEKQDVSVRCPREVQDKTAFVAVDADKIARVPAPITLPKRRPPGAGLVSARRLDLDHVSAVIGKDHRAIRPAEHASEVDDLDAVKRAIARICLARQLAVRRRPSLRHVSPPMG